MYRFRWRQVLAAAAVTATAALATMTGYSAATAAQPQQQLVWSGTNLWQNVGSESKSIAKCDRDMVMVGRSHDGDENGPSAVRCTFLRTSSGRGGPIVRTSGTTKSEWIKESSGRAFTCPTNSVMSLRLHVNDENGDTQYRCQSLELFRGDDEKEHPVITSDVVWSGSVKEANSSYTCPENKVLVGREHTGDENGSTRYQCAALQVAATGGASR
ncbi:hypothetical protein FHW23_002678 [Curtobacterium pusillum]|uniref:Ig-like domain-containing protein n=1 Tax=Curtobacterium pusillum TaxID=69373 RepID=A0AAW3T8D3_9MICO|nr:hypothetical protein [Curtobacterium pusillum]MBA8991409.1 hypothetical protein [Curtobacterium pusillum]